MSASWSLAIAIVAEIAATTALRSSDGLTRPLPSLVMVLGYAIAFAAFSQTLRAMPVGTAYAIWAGAGTAGALLVGWWRFREVVDAAQLGGVALIVAGVVVLHAGQIHSVPAREPATPNLSPWRADR